MKVKNKFKVNDRVITCYNQEGIILVITDWGLYVVQTEYGLGEYEENALILQPKTKKLLDKKL